MTSWRPRLVIILVVLVVLATNCFFVAQNAISSAEESGKEIHRNSSLVLDAEEQISMVVHDNNSSLDEKSGAPFAKDEISIPMNQNSSYVQSDVSKIVHIPSENRIEVHLNPNQRRCQNPLLQGRISGWSLSMIQFENITDNMVVGNYDLRHIPISGQYYLEVLVILCEKYGDDYRSVNIKRTPCLEINADDRHQLTAGNGLAIMELVALDNSKLFKDFKGRWVHESLISNDRQLLPKNETLQLERPRPLYTPYQPARSKNNENHHLGKDRREIIYEYIYQWNELGSDAVLNQPGLSGLLSRNQQEFGSNRNAIGDPNTSKTHACFLGFSHSKELRIQSSQVLRTTLQVAKERNLTTSLLDDFRCCSHIQVHYPTINDDQSSEGGIKEGAIQQMEAIQCTHVVVGLFQWYFSFIKEPSANMNFSFDEWKFHMSRVVEMLGQRSLPSSIRRLYLRSAHPNGFGSRHTNCPSEDFRTPYNAKIATEISREIVNEHPGVVSLMDTSFLMDAIWDSADDWNHYKGLQEFTESQYVLSKIINDSV